MRTPPRLLECTDKGLAATKSRDKVGAAAWHHQFHIVLERAARNPYIEQALSPLRHRTELVFSVLQEEWGTITWKEHRAIDAVGRGDATAASDLMREHIAVVVRYFETC
jgi:DNA-binding GntR family transcriptional regulator